MNPQASQYYHDFFLWEVMLRTHLLWNTYRHFGLDHIHLRRESASWVYSGRIYLWGCGCNNASGDNSSRNGILLSLWTLTVLLLRTIIVCKNQSVLTSVAFAGGAMICLVNIQKNTIDIVQVPMKSRTSYNYWRCYQHHLMVVIYGKSFQ